MAVKREPLDIIFSKVVREAHDYTCACCSKNYRHDPGYMHCAHIHTRKHRATRWDVDLGAIGLCAKCHRRFTDYPIEWGDFVRTHLGVGAYDEAKRRAWSVRKFTKAEKQEMLQHYKEELKRLERLRAEGEVGYIRPINYE